MQTGDISFEFGGRIFNLGSFHSIWSDVIQFGVILLILGAENAFWGQNMHFWGQKMHFGGRKCILGTFNANWGQKSKKNWGQTISVP
jgi:hypothetical protein